METVSEAESTNTEVGASAPNSEVEKKAIECFAAFEAADDNRDSAGKAFGDAVLKLHEEIKNSGGRDFMARLGQLNISYEKARYWMNKAQGKPTDRHKTDSTDEPQESGSDSTDAPQQPDSNSARAQENRDFNWDAARARLEKLSHDITMLRLSKPDGFDILVDPLKELADQIGYKIVLKGGDNV